VKSIADQLASQAAVSETRIMCRNGIPAIRVIIIIQEEKSHEKK
jgi:hypothetical protein